MRIHFSEYDVALVRIAFFELSLKEAAPVLVPAKTGEICTQNQTVPIAEVEMY